MSTVRSLENTPFQFRRDAVERLDKTRQKFLAAWQEAQPHMTAEERALDLTGTLNAMVQIMQLEGGK